MQDTVGDAHLNIWRNHVDMVWFDLETFRHLNDRERSLAGQQSGQSALMLRREMVNEAERDVGRHGQCFKELGKRFEAASGRSDADGRRYTRVDCGVFLVEYGCRFISAFE